MVFPVLFSAGMSLIDTLDGLLMLGAYGWAYLKPIRKIYYNMTITLVSVVVAIVIGSIEALGLISDKLKLQGPLWDCDRRAERQLRHARLRDHRHFCVELAGVRADLPREEIRRHGDQPVTDNAPFTSRQTKRPVMGVCVLRPFTIHFARLCSIHPST